MVILLLLYGPLPGAECYPGGPSTLYSIINRVLWMIQNLGVSLNGHLIVRINIAARVNVS